MTPTEKAQALRELADWCEKWNTYLATEALPLSVYLQTHQWLLSLPTHHNEVDDNYLRKAADQLEKEEA